MLGGSREIFFVLFSTRIAWEERTNCLDVAQELQSIWFRAVSKGHVLVVRELLRCHDTRNFLGFRHPRGADARERGQYKARYC
jgi:hypothetical protein